MSITSLFALFVGMFIIYNSFAIAVTERRAEIGILRALGATRRQIRALFLAESGVAGLVSVVCLLIEGGQIAFYVGFFAAMLAALLLMLSLAMTIGLGGVARASYESITDWMGTALNPYLFVTASPTLTSRSFLFAAYLGPTIRQIDGVEEGQSVRTPRILFRKTPVMLIAVEVEKWAARAPREPLEGRAGDSARSASGAPERGSNTIDLIWSPRLTPSRLPLPGGRWATLATDMQVDDYGISVVQLERQSGEWLLVGGYAGQFVTERRSDAKPKRSAFDRGLARTFLGRASYTIDVNRSLAFEGAVRQDGGGVWAKAEYSQAIGQHWRATVRVHLLGGSADDFLGQYRRNSSVRVAIRYS